MTAKRQSSKVRARSFRIFGYIITIAKIQPVAKPKARKSRPARANSSIGESKEVKPTTLLDSFPTEQKNGAEP